MAMPRSSGPSRMAEQPTAGDGGRGWVLEWTRDRNVAAVTDRRNTLVGDVTAAGVRYFDAADTVATARPARWTR
jgi:hypothetical protein